MDSNLPCKPYFDIDWVLEKEPDEKTKVKYITEIINAFKTIFSLLNNKIYPIFDIVDSFGYIEEIEMYKLSLHIIVNGVGSTTNKKIIIIKAILTNMFNI